MKKQPEDDRTVIGFDSPRNLAEVFPWRSEPDQLKCSVCGSASGGRAPADMMVIKHHHAGQPLGHLRLYCAEHYAAHKPSMRLVLATVGSSGATCPTCFLTMAVEADICENCFGAS